MLQVRNRGNDSFSIEFAGTTVAWEKETGTLKNWDGEAEPSVEVPLGDFFCCGFGQTYAVHSQPVVVLPRRGFNAYFPMPFRSRARITIENQHKNPIREFFYQIDYNLYEDLPENMACFHAQWRRQPITEKANIFRIPFFLRKTLG